VHFLCLDERIWGRGDIINKEMEMKIEDEEIAKEREKRRRRKLIEKPLQQLALKC
jgi:hypothetical protein